MAPPAEKQEKNKDTKETVSTIVSVYLCHPYLTFVEIEIQPHLKTDLDPEFRPLTNHWSY